MPLTIFAQGETNEKVVDGNRRLAYPLAGDNDLSMGVGLGFDNGQAVFWGLAQPKKVIASYRGMKIAELVEEFGHGTLAACWYTGNRAVHPTDQRYVDEIETKIGKPARERILGMVPENFDHVLTVLQESGIDFAGWEIEEEVKSGILKVTPTIQTYLDKFHRKQDLTRQEGYGRLISPEQAQAAIENTPFLGALGRLFLEAYNQHVDPNTRVAVRHRDFGVGEDYIIAKSRADARVEVTVKGGLKDPIIMAPQPTLRISLQYDGRDVEFQPNFDVGKRPKQKGFLSGLTFWRKTPEKEEPSMTEKFPLLTREYGASIFPLGRLDDPTIEMKVDDEKLRELANELQQSIQRVLAA